MAEVARESIAGIMGSNTTGFRAAFTLSSSLLVVRGEVQNLFESLKLHGAAHESHVSVFSENERTEQDQSLRERAHEDLLCLLTCLRDRLQSRGLSDLTLIEILSPFIQVIQSSVTTAVPTAVALASVLRFIKVGVIHVDDSQARDAVSMIADAVVQCRFEQTDSGADEIAIMWILESLTSLVGCEAGTFLLDEEVWSIVQAMFVISVSKTHADMLRALAHRALTDVLGKILKRVLCVDETQCSYGMPCLLKIFAFFVAAIDPYPCSSKPLCDHIEGSETCMPSLKFLVRIFECIIQYSESVCSKTTLNLFMECGPLVTLTVDDLFGHLIQIAQSYIRGCQHKITDPSPDPNVPSADIFPNAAHFPDASGSSLTMLSGSLQLIGVLFSVVPLRRRLKFQLEVFINSVVIRALESPPVDSAAKVIILECLYFMLSDKSFVVDMFINYDCDYQSSDVLENLFKFLSRSAFPKRVRFNRAELEKHQIAALKCISCGISALSDRCDVPDGPSGEHVIRSPSYLLLEEVRQKKKAKATLVRCAELFNRKPKTGIAELVSAGIIKRQDSDVTVVAAFLRNTPNLDKRIVGQFLGERDEFNQLVLKEFVETFNMSGQTLLDSLRMFLESFRLPGEAQQIDRILQQFANAAHSNTVDGALMSTPDCTYLFCFSIIMLNTDLHNPNIRPEKKMSMDAFVRNNTNYGPEVSCGKDLGRDFLEGVFKDIKERQINTMCEGNDLTAEVTVDKWRDLLQRNNLLKSASSAKLSGIHHFSPDEMVVHCFLAMHNAQMSTDHGIVEPRHDMELPVVSSNDTNSVTWSMDRVISLRSYDSLIFETVLQPCIAVLSVIFDTVDASCQPEVLKASLECILLCAKCASSFHMCKEFDSIVVSLCKFTSLLVYSNGRAQYLPQDGENDGEVRAGDHEHENLSRENSFIETTSSSGIQAIDKFGLNQKAQMAAMSVFAIARRYTQSIALSWGHLIELMYRLSDLGLLRPDIYKECNGACIDRTLRVRLHESIARRSIRAAKDRVRHLVNDREAGAGWLAGWLFGNNENEASSALSLAGAKLNVCETEAAERIVRASFFEEDSLGESDVGADTHDVDTPRKFCEMCVRSCRVHDFLLCVNELPEYHLVRFVNALISSASYNKAVLKDCSNNGDATKGTDTHSRHERRESWLVVQDTDSDIMRGMEKFPDPSLASICFGVHLLTNIMIKRNSLLPLLWPDARRFLFGFIHRTQEPTFVLEKVCVGILRIALNGMLISGMVKEMVHSIQELMITCSIIPQFYPLLCHGVQRIILSDTIDLEGECATSDALRILELSLDIKFIPAAFAQNVLQHMLNTTLIAYDVPSQRAAAIFSKCAISSARRKDKEGACRAIDAIFFLLTTNSTSGDSFSVLKSLSSCFHSTPLFLRMHILEKLRCLLIGDDAQLIPDAMEWAFVFAHILLPICAAHTKSSTQDGGSTRETGGKKWEPYLLLLQCLHAKLSVLILLPGDGFYALWNQMLAIFSELLPSGTSSLDENEESLEFDEITKCFRSIFAKLNSGKLSKSLSYELEFPDAFQASLFIVPENDVDPNKHKIKESQFVEKSSNHGSSDTDEGTR